MAKSNTKHPKEITLYIRVGPDLKKHLEQKAKQNGLSTSAYARMLMIQGSGFNPDLD
jgi:hypothetical protein